MAQQDDINALVARLNVVATKVATLEADDAAAIAAAAQPVDLTALTNEVTAVEAAVAAGLPAAPAPAPETPPVSQ